MNSTIKNVDRRFARRFLISLSKIRASNRVGDGGIGIRSQKIKMAAYSSMAQAVGSRRAWSRAILLKGRRNRAKVRRILQSRNKGLKKKKRVMTRDNYDNKVTRTRREISSKAEMLRRLIPGGATMYGCELLEETADYLKCLQTQVEVMKGIVDYYSKEKNSD